MSAGPFPLLSSLFGDPEMAAVFSEERTIAAWLEVEAALAEAEAAAGMIPAAAAREIAAACKLENIDREALWAEARNVGYPILPLVRMIDAALPASATGNVHVGATTQDIMDSGFSLQLREARARLLALLGEYGEALAQLVEDHRRTLLAARTHGQQAVPTTFGAKLAVHLFQLARLRGRLEDAGPRLAVVSLFGAGGTSAALGDRAGAVRAELARLLELEPATVPWHVARDGVAEFGHLCAALAAASARFAREVVDLSRTEIGELGEPDGHHRGASSTMPQKANPIGSEAVIGMAATAGALSSALYRAMEAGHERAAGEWQVEWEAVPMLAVLAAGSLANAGVVAAGLRVFPEAMRRNLEGDGYVMAEAEMMRLAGELGRERAHDLVYDAVREAQASGRPLEQALADALGDSAAPIPAEDYVGDPDATCDAALAAWRRTEPT